MIKQKPGHILNLKNKVKALKIDLSRGIRKEPSIQRRIPVGACLSYDFAGSARFRKIVASNFDIVVFENLLKVTSLVSREGCRNSKDGTPVLIFSRADRMMRWAQRNGLKVHGHCLMYHKSMHDWFFREGYDYGAQFVSREECLFRMKSCIEQVITHFEKKFPGVIISWDVVNERIAETDKDRDLRSGDWRRAYWDGQANLLRDLIGKDYVEKAFLFARDTVDNLGADIRLYLNDFNAFKPQKRERLIQLVNDINHYSKDSSDAYRRLCDGVGMQGYLGGINNQAKCLTQSIKEEFLESLKRYHNEGIRVLITEMTVRNYDRSKEMEHADYCVDLIKGIRRLIDSGDAELDGLIFWGMVDISEDETESEDGWNPHGGLLRRDFSDKGILKRILEVL